MEGEDVAKKREIEKADRTINTIYYLQFFSYVMCGWQRKRRRTR